jgi:hypothetical protein
MVNDMVRGMGRGQPEEEKWLPDQTGGGGVKGMVLTPEYDSDCMFRCFLMGAFERFLDRIVPLVPLHTSTPCRLPGHDLFVQSHKWCVERVAAWGGAAHISLAIEEGDIGWWIQ